MTNGSMPFQIRYYRDGDERNNYKGITKKILCSDIENEGTLSKFDAVSQIGIQTLPGMQFKINNSSHWIEVSDLGIYELDLTNKGAISSLYFNDVTGSWNESDFFLFIDIIHKGSRL